MAQVHSDKPYKCDCCQAAFRYKGNLASHKTVHTGKSHCRLCLIFRTQGRELLYSPAFLNLQVQSRTTATSAELSLTGQPISRHILVSTLEKSHTSAKRVGPDSSRWGEEPPPPKKTTFSSLGKISSVASLLTLVIFSRRWPTFVHMC